MTSVESPGYSGQQIRYSRIGMPAILWQVTGRASYLGLWKSYSICKYSSLKKARKLQTAFSEQAAKAFCGKGECVRQEAIAGCMQTWLHRLLSDCGCTMHTAVPP